MHTLKLWIQRPVPTVDPRYCFSVSALNHHYSSSGNLRLQLFHPNGTELTANFYLTDYISSWIVWQAREISERAESSAQSTWEVRTPVQVLQHSRVVADNTGQHSMMGSVGYIRLLNNTRGATQTFSEPTNASWWLSAVPSPPQNA